MQGACKENVKLQLVYLVNCPELPEGLPAKIPELEYKSLVHWLSAFNVKVDFCGFESGSELLPAFSKQAEM